MGLASDRLPVTRGLTLVYVLSLAVAILMAGVCLTGIISPSVVYPSEELRGSYLPGDVVHLIIGLPALVGSMWLTRRGKLVGLLLWPGALFYAVYDYLARLFDVPFGVVYLPYLTIFTLSAYSTIALVASTDAGAVGQRLEGVVPNRLAGGVLAGLAIVFALRAVAVMAGTLMGDTPGAPPDLAVLIADFFVNVGWLFGGILLWRRDRLGYVTGLGLLFQGSTLFVGVILFLIIQALITAAPLVWVDIAVLVVLALPVLIPFVLYLRGVGSSQPQIYAQNPVDRASF
jgi:hypothetical protein